MAAAVCVKLEGHKMARVLGFLETFPDIERIDEQFLSQGWLVIHTRLLQPKLLMDRLVSLEGVLLVQENAMLTVKAVLPLVDLRGIQ